MNETARTSVPVRIVCKERSVESDMSHEERRKEEEQDQERKRSNKCRTVAAVLELLLTLPFPRARVLACIR